MHSRSVTTITPHSRRFELNLAEIWEYRDLVVLFVRRDFVAQYKQTLLGPVWHVLQPLLTTLVFTLVFGRIARLPTDGIPPFLFYFAGVVIWTYFANVFTEISSTFVNNAGVFGKVYFPRLVTPVSILLSRLIAFFIQYLIFLALLVFFAAKGQGISPNIWILFTPVLVLMMGLLALGGGVIVTALTTKYRDLAVLVTFGVQLLMFATPIIYPLSSLPEPWRFWAALNPIAPIVECFRYAYLGSGVVDATLLGASFLTILFVLFFGATLFNRVEKKFMDTI